MNKQSFWKKTLAVTAMAVLGTGMAFGGAADPAAAASGSSVLKEQGSAAVKKASDQGLTNVKDAKETRDGYTLEVPELMYDGIQLIMVVNHPGGMSFPKILIDGKALNGDAAKMQISSVPVSSKGKTREEVEAALKGTSMITFRNAVDPSSGQYIFPDQFELTFEAKVGKSKEPLKVNIPVKSIAKRQVNMQPNAKKTEQKFSYEVKSLRMTDVSTMLEIHSKGQIPRTPQQSANKIATQMLYDIVDDKGKLIESEIAIYSKVNPEYKELKLYSPVDSTAKFITIKPFTCFVNKNGKAVEDKNGNLVKDYHKALEMKIQIAK